MNCTSCAEGQLEPNTDTITLPLPCPQLAAALAAVVSTVKWWWQWWPQQWHQCSNSDNDSDCSSSSSINTAMAMTTMMTAVVAASFSYSVLYLQVNSANTSCFSVIMCVILSLAVYTIKKKKLLLSQCDTIHTTGGYRYYTHAEPYTHLLLVSSLAW